MTKPAPTAPQSPPKRRLARKALIPLALVVAVGGFVTGVMGGPLVSPDAVAPGAVVQMETGPFAVSGLSASVSMVKANVSVQTGRSAPDGPGPLHDAMLSLLTQAAALPLVQDGRQSLPEVERVVMAMARDSAPWLVALELRPADLSTAAAEPDPAETQSAS